MKINISQIPQGVEKFDILVDRNDIQIGRNEVNVELELEETEESSNNNHVELLSKT